MELFGFTIAMSVFWLTMAGLVLAVAAPVFWFWMLLDALLREERDYPGGSGNERLVWALLIFFVHVAAVFYFFMVYRRPRTAAPPQPAAPCTA